MTKKSKQEKTVNIDSEQNEKQLFFSYDKLIPNGEKNEKKKSYIIFHIFKVIFPEFSVYDAHYIRSFMR